MSRLPRLLTRAVKMAARRLLSNRKQPAPTAQPPRATPAEDPGRSTASEPEVSPGQAGDSATVQIAPGQIGAVAMTYAPNPDGDPDPGEVVWTWVPFEENDGRGKDRPVLLVAAEPTGTLLGVQLTSKKHSDTDFVPVGTGGWDSDRRPSWANLERVIRVHPDGMRREGTALARDRFDAVAAALRSRYGFGSGGDRTSG